MEENFRLVVLRPDSETLSQKEKVSLLSKSIGKCCLKKEIDTAENLFKCVNEVSASRL